MHTERMNILKGRGFRPRIILDIGAHEGLWAREAKQVFDMSEVVMFEANPAREETLKKSGFKYVMGCLAETEDKPVQFFTMKNGKYSTGDSVFLENTHHYEESNRAVTVLQTTTLDKSLSAHNIKHKHVDFIKLDVQGSEKSILLGGREALANAEVVLMEVQILEYNLGAPKLAEMILFMDLRGFELFDVYGLYYLPECKLLNQADLLFIKKGSSLIPKTDLK